MRTTKLLLLTMLLTVAGRMDANAQTISSPFKFIENKMDLGLFAGYMFADAGRAELGPYPGPLAGAQFNLGLSGPMNVGFYASYFPTERDVINPKEGGAIIGQTSMDMLLITGQLKLQLTGARTWNDLAPYLYLGLGFAFDLATSPDCFSDPSQPECQLLPRDRFSFGTVFVGQFGFGTIFLPFERLGLRATVDDSIWQLTTPVGFYDEESTIDPVPPSKDWTNNIQLTLGAYYWF